MANIKLYVMMGLLSGALFVSVLFNGFNGYFYGLLRSPRSKSFNFFWSPEERNITVGKVFWLNLTFMNVAENLSITVKANDDEGGCGLILVFDRDRNGKIDFDLLPQNTVADTPYHFDSYNTTSTPWVVVRPKGQVMMLSGDFNKISPWHTCTYSNKTGFVFNISLPLDEIGPTGIVYAIFDDYDNPILEEPNSRPHHKYDPNSMWVYTEFNYL